MSVERACRRVEPLMTFNTKNLNELTDAIAAFHTQRQAYAAKMAELARTFRDVGSRESFYGMQTGFFYVADQLKELSEDHLAVCEADRSEEQMDAMEETLLIPIQKLIDDTRKAAKTLKKKKAKAKQRTAVAELETRIGHNRKLLLSNIKLFEKHRVAQLKAMLCGLMEKEIQLHARALELLTPAFQNLHSVDTSTAVAALEHYLQAEDLVVGGAPPDAEGEHGKGEEEEDGDDDGDMYEDEDEDLYGHNGAGLDDGDYSDVGSSDHDHDHDDGDRDRPARDHDRGQDREQAHGDNDNREDEGRTGRGGSGSNGRAGRMDAPEQETTTTTRTVNATAAAEARTGRAEGDRTSAAPTPDSQASGAVSR